MFLSLCPLSLSLSLPLSLFLVLSFILLYKFLMLTPYQMYQWICSPIQWLSFYFGDGLLCCAKFFSLISSHVFISFFLFPLTEEIYQEKNSAMRWDFTAYVFFWDFMVSSLFKSLIKFEFILACGIRRWSSFIFLHISIQFSQHHLLNKLCLVHSMYLPYDLVIALLEI